MSKESEIKQLIRNISAYNSGLTLFEAEVTASEDTECVIKYQGLEHKNVRLVCGFSQSSTTMIIKPAVGSTVLVADLSNGKMRDGVVLMVENVEKVIFNGGELGGLIKIEELKTQLNKMTARIDGIINAIKGGVPISQDGGAALQTSIVKLLPTGQKEDFSSLEDPKFLH